MSKKEEKQSFEAALRRLEQIVAEMESGETGLDAMIAAFEEGQRLLKVCSGKLDEVEKKIEKVIKGSDGEVTVEPFELKAEE